MSRRSSEDLNNQTHEKKVLKNTKIISFKKITRPQHLDISPKKRPSFLKRFMKGIRRPRPRSQSSTSSSVSLPSLPKACDDFVDEVGDEKNQNKDFRKRGDFVKMSPPKKFYQHRGSMSFSSGDLEKYEYEQIAETLEQISISFNRQIYSRSSTPGCHYVYQSGMTLSKTPEPWPTQPPLVEAPTTSSSQAGGLEVDGTYEEDDQSVDRVETIPATSYSQSSSVDSPMTDIPSTSTGITNEDHITMDKLVELLVERLITRGDHVENTVGLQTTLEPVIRQYATNYLSNLTYNNFHTIAGRVIRSVGHMISNFSESPEIFEVVMGLDLLTVMYEITTSDSAFQHVRDLSTRYVHSLTQNIPSVRQILERCRNFLASFSPSFNHNPTEDSNEILDEEVD